MAEDNLTTEEVQEEKRKVRTLVDSENRIEKEKALQKAKELEKKEIPSAEHESEGMKEFIKESENAKELLGLKKKKNKE